MGRISCIFQSGASYQTSPAMMSILPSLFTSATATPSDRNFLSMTVFFQWTSDAGTPLVGPSVAVAMATPIAKQAPTTSHIPRFTGDPPDENSLANVFEPF